MNIILQIPVHECDVGVVGNVLWAFEPMEFVAFDHTGRVLLAITMVASIFNSNMEKLYDASAV